MTDTRLARTSSLVPRQNRDVTSSMPLAKPRAEATSNRPRTGKLAFAGVAVIALFAGGLSYWSARAPLASAAVAQGQVSLETNRKTVQHLEGGIVSEIRVREGQHVSAGDILLVLDRTQTQATNTLLHARISAAREKAGLIKEELDSVAALVKQGYGSNRRLLSLKRSLTDVEGQIQEEEARLNANRDTMKRAEVRAPVSGAVVGLQVHTVGGVIKTGEELLSIIPKRERLVIEARVSPLDIDVVRPGLEAQVRLSAFSARTLAPISGAVNSISADRLKDETTGQEYYLARVALPEQNGDRLGSVTLLPGMPVEVAILTGSRTIVDYLLAPLVKSFNRAFREE